MPINGAMVVFYSMDSKKSVYQYTDNTGESKEPKIGFPLVRSIFVTGYESRVDTLIQSSSTLEELIISPIHKNLDQVTITGSLVPGYQSNSVYSVKVIDRVEIDRRAANNIKDLLSSELNMRISNDQILGSSLSIQGTGGENIKYLIDGVPIVGKQNGSIDLNEMLLSNIEKVEIVKGPMSVLYGTDALAGVVNLITKTNTKQKLSGGVNAYYENTGQYNLDGSLGWGFKKSAISVNAGRYYFDGWDDVSDNRFQVLKPKEQYFGNFKISHTFKSWNVNAQLNYNKDKITDKGVPIITPYYAKAFDHYYTTWRLNNQIVANKTFNEVSALQITGAYSFYQHIRNSYVMDMVSLSDQLIQSNLDNDTTKFNSVFARANYSNQNFLNTFSLLSGVDYTTESAIGSRIDNAKHEIADYAAYTSLEYKLFNNFSIKPSVRVIYNTNYDAPIIPSINVLFKPFQLTEIRLSWSTGFRAPSLKEQYLDFEDSNHNVHGNPSLKAEKSSHYLGSITFKKAMNNSVLCLEPSVFYNQINNRISLVEVDSKSMLYQYTNIKKFNSKGAEMSIRLNHNNFNCSVGSSLTGIKESFDGISEQSDVAWYSEYNAIANYSFSKIQTSISLQWKSIGKKPVYRLNADYTFSSYEN